MKHLHTLRVSAPARRPGTSHMDLVLVLAEGGRLPLQAERVEVDRILRCTHCNLVQIIEEGTARQWLGLISEWPLSCRSNRLILIEATARESICLHTRVNLSDCPRAVVDGRSALVKESVWVVIQGSADLASEPIGASFPFEAGKILAGDLRLPRGVTLASPGSQVLFRLQEAEPSLA